MRTEEDPDGKAEHDRVDKPLSRDDRVSLYPLDPEQAIRALLNTPRKQDPA